MSYSSIKYQLHQKGIYFARQWALARRQRYRIWKFHHKKLSHITRGTTEAYYNYDSQGLRIRKVVEKNGVTETRLYLGGFEIWRKKVNGVLDLERETLHVMDDQKRIALVETLTVNSGTVVANHVPVLRYQLDNHLGSASLELDDLANVISYEEYYPYGDTSYRAGRTASEVSQKRYRYTGKEKDEESGLYYHGARYYACWLGRWTAADPIGLVDGVNLYGYVRGNPVRLSDPSGNAGEEEISIGGLIEKGKQYIEEKYNESISSSIEYVQTEINQIQEKAKNGEDLSFSEKAFLRGVYRSFIIGGKLKGMPEASELLSHYLGGKGDPADAPYELDSEVYETSAIVQYAMEKMTEHVKELHAKGKNVEGNYRSSEILKPTPKRDSVTEGRVLGKKDGYALISEQSNTRLKYADHRFHLNLNVNLAENGKDLELTWSVKSKWDYEPYSDEKSNSAHVTKIPWNKEKNQVLKLDDGLSEHLTKIGMAKEFYHEAKWTTKLNFKK